MRPKKFAPPRARPDSPTAGALAAQQICFLQERSLCNVITCFFTAVRGGGAFFYFARAICDRDLARRIVPFLLVQAEK